MRSMASLAIGCARLKRQPVLAGLTLADDIHGIVSRVAVVERTTPRGADPLSKLSGGFIKSSDLPDRRGSRPEV